MTRIGESFETYSSLSVHDMLRGRIAAGHDVPPLRWLAKAAAKYLRAYNNQSNYPVNFNGEGFALRAVTAATPGDVFDVGANEGQWATMALDVIGARRLHCFEVAPATAQLLRQRLEDRPNVSINNVGLGADTRTIDLYFYPKRTDRSSAYLLNDGFTKEQVKASVIPGDEYVEQNNIDEIAFLKLDVEGMEMEVIHGFERSLRSGVVKAIQIEHTPSHVLSRHFLKDFVDVLRPFDFHIYRCFPNALRALHYDVQWDEDFTGENFIAMNADTRSRVAGIRGERLRA